MNLEYINKLEKAQANYNTIQQGYYYAYVRDVCLKSNNYGKLIEIYLEYIDPYTNSSKAIVSHYYLERNSRFKTFEMLMPVMTYYLKSNSAAIEYLCETYSEISDDDFIHILKDALYHQLVTIKVELYASNKKNIRIIVPNIYVNNVYV